MTELANPELSEVCTRKTGICTASEIQKAISGLLKRHFPEKTWAVIGALFKLKERGAKYRLANQSSYTIEELQVLIQGEDGLEYLEALMADAEPVWWTWQKWVAEQAKLERIAADALQQKMQLESKLPMTAPRPKDTRNVKNLRSNFSKTKTALGLLHSNAGRTVAGPMAETKAQRR